MELRNFSKYTYTSYLGKTKDLIKYFKKPLEEVNTEELRKFLVEYLKEERKLSDRSINYYNSVIRFVYEVTYYISCWGHFQKLIIGNKFCNIIMLNSELIFDIIFKAYLIEVVICNIFF